MKQMEKDADVLSRSGPFICMFSPNLTTDLLPIMRVIRNIFMSASLFMIIVISTQADSTGHYNPHSSPT